MQMTVSLGVDEGFPGCLHESKNLVWIRSMWEMNLVALQHNCHPLNNPYHVLPSVPAWMSAGLGLPLNCLWQYDLLVVEEEEPLVPEVKGGSKTSVTHICRRLNTAETRNCNTITYHGTLSPATHVSGCFGLSQILDPPLVGYEWCIEVEERGHPLWPTAVKHSLIFQLRFKCSK